MSESRTLHTLAKSREREKERPGVSLNDPQKLAQSAIEEVVDPLSRPRFSYMYNALDNYANIGFELVINDI